MTEQYLILKNIKIANANAIAGFTYGFPAVSHFLGYVHAISRKLQQGDQAYLDNIILDDVGIISHHHQVHAHRENQYEPYSFALTRNPLTKEGKTAPINEEGRMHLTVSLIIRAQGINLASLQTQQQQCAAIKALAERHKLAGGRVLSIDSCTLTNDTNHRKILRKLWPGFVLCDRSYLLEQHHQPETEPLDSWLDFICRKRGATDTTVAGKEGKVEWEWQPRPAPGYLVPLQVGYKKIAPTFAPGEVANVRDDVTPVSFVEPVHSIGEWVGAPSKLHSLQEIMWQYHDQDPFYLCRTPLNFEDVAHDDNDFAEFYDELEEEFD